MHPELLENPQFLRSYQKWQQDTKSIAFIPVAEYFLKYNLTKEAFEVCGEGIKNHPSLISARILMAKILTQSKRYNEAIDELQHVLSYIPSQPVAREMLLQIQEELSKPVVESNQITKSPIWCTITMADIHAKQGNVEEAKKIYETILNKEPNNSMALKGLENLGLNR